MVALGKTLMPIQLQQKIFNRNIRLMLGAVACVGFSFVGLHSVLFNLYLVRLGFGTKFIGAAHGSMMLLITLFSFPGGWLGRKFGGRICMTIGMGVAAAYGLIPLAGYSSSLLQPVLIFTGMCCLGLGGALFVANLPSFIMANCGADERNRAFAIRGATTRVFAFVGSLVGGFLPGLISSVFNFSLDGPKAFGAALLLAPLIFALGFVFMLLTVKAEDVLRETAGEKEEAMPVRAILVASLILLLVSGGFRSAVTFFNVYMDVRLETSTSLIGSVVAVAQLLGVPAALFMPALVKRLGRPRALAVTMAMLFVSLIGFAFLRHWAAASVLFCVVVALLAIHESAYAAHGQELVSPGWRPIMGGALAAAMGIGTGAIGIGGGFLIDGWGYQPLFLLGAGLAFAGAILFVWRFRLKNGARLVSE